MRRLLFNLRHLSSYLARRPVFELDYYRESELARLANLFAHVNLEDWNGARILEVGAGLGHLGDYFAALGFDVTSTDGRPEHVERMRQRGREAFVLDLDLEGIEGVGDFQIVLAFGVLYHLSKPEEFLRSCARHARVLLLESAVCDATEPVLTMVPERTEGWLGQDQALHRLGCRPSISWVENVCRDAGFTDIRDISNPTADWEIGTFDWEPTGKGEWQRGRRNLRRMWVMRTQASS